MSNRDSLGFGDLLPQDVVEVFAQEKHGKRGLKKRSRSLGRAFSWLKGRRKKKKKKLCSNGQSPGLGPALDLALDRPSAGHQGGHKGGQKSGRQTPQGNSHAIPKRDENDKPPAPQLFPENVFIESSRPKYLEDLHTEALAGLKMMQQEETGNGVEYLDSESTISIMTVQTDGESGGFVTDSTLPDSSSVVSMRSSVSTRSSRSGITRQGSSFRPLNSGKKSEKAKRRRRQRRTVVGIPQHVQKELGLDRTGWIHPLDEEQLHNGETDNSPSTDGPQEAVESSKEAGTSFKARNPVQPLSKDIIEQLGAPHAGHRDDLALLDRLAPDLAGEQRPRSLAVPWMTTASSLQQQPPSPVMTMSPQAAYMSKIIPNAVLPPSIDVVEISRSRSRNSVRTVSKSSLLLPSPAPSRASSRASSVKTTSSHITSVSQYNFPNMSDTSCWSNTDSSETLVSDSSTISSSSTPRQKRSQDGDASSKEDKVSVISSNCTSNSKLRIKGDKKKNGQFVRSLSVMKSKRAPPPPRRSNSLHSKSKLRPRDLADVRGISGEASLNSTSVPGEESEKDKLELSQIPSKTVDSPGYHADTSSLDDSTGSASFSFIKSQLQKPKTEDAKRETETVSPKASPEKKETHEKKLNKVISPSSGYSSQDATSPKVSEHPHNNKNKKGILAKLQRLFPGSTSAGSALPAQTRPVRPEIKQSNGKPKPDSTDAVSASPSVRTLRDLFNIPPPPKVHAPPPPPPEVWAHNKRTFELLLGPPAPENTYAIIKRNPKDRRQQRQSPSVSSEGSVKSSVHERKHKNPTVAVEAVNGSPCVLEAKRFQENGVLNGETPKENKERLAENGGLKENSKDEKVRVCDMLSGVLMKAVEKREGRLAATEEGGQNTPTQSIDAKTNMDTLPAISLRHISPSPTSTPGQQRPQRPTLRTAEPASITSVQAVSPESSWPPPPPPMVPVGVGGLDEIDYPLPPPPLFGEGGLVLPVQVPPKDPGFGGELSLRTGFVKPETKVESVAIPPPPAYTAPPPPPCSPPPPPPTTSVQASSAETVSLKTEEVSPLPLPVGSEESPISVVQDAIPPIPVTSASPAKEALPPLVVETSPPPPEEVAALPAAEFTPKHSPEDAVQLSEDAVQPAEDAVQPAEDAVQLFEDAVQPAEDAVQVSEDAVQLSEDAVPLSEDAVPLSEDAVPLSEDAVQLSGDAVQLSGDAVQLSEDAVQLSEDAVQLSEDAVQLSEDAVQLSEDAVQLSEDAVQLSEDAVQLSEDAVQLSGDAVQLSGDAVQLSGDAVQPAEDAVQPAEDAVQPAEDAVPLSEDAVPLSEDAVPLSEDAVQCVEDAPPESELPAPQSTPPPPPLPSEQKIDPPQENVPLKPETNTDTSNSILKPPESIPPPPPASPLLTPSHVSQATDKPVIDGAPPSPPSEFRNPPSSEQAEEPASSPTVTMSLPSTSPEVIDIEDQSSPQSQEETSAPVVDEQPTTDTTPSPPNVVNGSPEPPEEAQEQPEPEVPADQQQPSGQIPTCSATSEAPQKPIRRSLIVACPTSASPPVVDASQITVPKSVSPVLPPAPSSAGACPVKKSPPATTSAPSMNLQEAIRLRTAARSRESSSSRFSLSPPSKSPTSTASFIFSKSNTKVVIETKRMPEDKDTKHKKLEVSSATKVISEAEETKKGPKVPPPVAKKPKATGKGLESCEVVEQTAGQEAQQESVHDGVE
ncbi:uncharacterized protein KIAA1522-like isoform X2 [Cololabis saira]|uniref:uncharacterized protein KIAA1522-like isoform X2 n=1 Tax=Cololabis saira TaxID=129043 RepID=UPI002AD1DBE7|nr:uncharacterized protein KIAA1522-like isoform X2 [Cololabis saira]